MNKLEDVPPIVESSFSLDGFDITAAFGDAVSGIANDAELQLDEKVRRIEQVIREGSSELYQDFVDLRAMASQMAAACSHDHALSEALSANPETAHFMREHADNDHEHSPEMTSDGRKPTDTKETKKKRKKRTRRSWFGIWYELN